MGSEIVNGLVAAAFIVILVRWLSSSKKADGTPGLATTLGFRPKNVTPEMIASVEGMFPDIPRENIHYDLLQTGSVEITAHKILEKGFLNAPPPAYLRAFPPTPRAPTAPGTPSISTSTKSTSTLISRFNLQDRVKSTELAPISSQPSIILDPKAVWEDTPAKREQSLKERKAQMILAARQRLLTKRQETDLGPPAQS